MKIGITISQYSPSDSIWTNGIKLNALILQKMLKHSERDYKVYLVNREPVELDHTTPWNIEKYPCISLQQAQEEMDLIIILGAQLNDDWIKEFKSKGENRKVVAYRCGNYYVTEMETILFKENSKDFPPNWNQEIDANWLIPQQEFNNFYYVQTYTRKPAFTVPFVWDPEFIEDFAKSSSKEGTIDETFYKPDRSTKRISVFEPNIGIIKYCMIPIHITEWAYRTPIGKDKIDFLSITNGLKLKENHEFNGHVKYLDIVKDRKMYVESRYPAAYFLKEHTDIVLSHQWGNALNYAYLDAMHFGYPLIHNAHFIKDLGFYYEDFNILEGAERLLEVLVDFDKDHESYKKRMAFSMNRYRSTNKGLIELYDKMIDELFGFKDWELTYEYDWKTNKFLS